VATVTGYIKTQDDTLLAGKDPAGAAAAAQNYAVQRGNHTGTQTADTITDGATNKTYTALEKTKLAGVATGATANRSDAATDTLLDAKAPTASPTFTGTVSGITASMVGADTAGAASTAQAAAIQRANHTGTQTSVTISDFTEAVQDAASAMFRAGTNVTFTYDDTANTFTINASGGGAGTTDPEVVRDTIGGALVGGANIQITVNDAADSITIAVTGLAPVALSGAYTDLTGRPTLGTAASQDSTAFDLAGAAAAVTKTSLGLGNVDNTPDTNKPVSTAQAAALALKASVAQSVRPNTIVLIGDSRIQYEMGAVAQQWNERGAFGWANAQLGGRFTVLNYAGIFGNQTTDVLTRLQTDALAYTPGWYLLGIGVNDISNGATAATVIANLQNIVGQMNAAGGRVILLTIAPRDANTATQKRALDDVNHWIVRQQTNPGIVVVDVTTPVADPTSGTWGATYSPDGLHQNRIGAARQGKQIAAVLDPIVPQRSLLPQVFGDGNNILVNPLMAGTPGAGLPTGTTSWTSSDATKCSMVARTDQIPGNWVQIDTSAATQDVTVNQRISLGTWGAIGDTMYGVCEIQSDAWTSAAFLTMYVQALNSSNGAIASAQALYSLSSDRTATYPLENQPGLTKNWTLVTPQVVLPTGTTKVNFVFEFSGQGKVRFSRAGIFKP